MTSRSTAPLQAELRKSRNAGGFGQLTRRELPFTVGLYGVSQTSDPESFEEARALVTQVIRRILDEATADTRAYGRRTARSLGARSLTQCWFGSSRDTVGSIRRALANSGSVTDSAIRQQEDRLIAMIADAIVQDAAERGRGRGRGPENPIDWENLSTSEAEDRYAQACAPLYLTGLSQQLADLVQAMTIYPEPGQPWYRKDIEPLENDMAAVWRPLSCSALVLRAVEALLELSLFDVDLPTPLLRAIHSRTWLSDPDALLIAAAITSREEEPSLRIDRDGNAERWVSTIDEVAESFRRNFLQIPDGTALAGGYATLVYLHLDTCRSDASPRCLIDHVRRQATTLHHTLSLAVAESITWLAAINLVSTSETPESMSRSVIVAQGYAENPTFEEPFRIATQDRERGHALAQARKERINSS